MRIKGLETLVRRTKLEIPRPDGGVVEVTVSPLPLGFRSDLVRDLPPPPVPMKVQGRNKDGPIMVEDTGNVEYRRELAYVDALQSTAMIYMATKDDPDIEWDTKPTDDRRQFYEGIYQELRAYGWTDAMFITLVQRIGEVSSLDEDSIARAKEAFLSETQTEK